MRVTLALTVILAAGAAQAQGALHAWCEEGRPGDDDVAEAPPASAPALILPCALIDSGRVGVAGDVGDGGLATACADSPFYVVTHAGVLLCQVDVDWFTSGAEHALERGPAAVAPSTSAPHGALTPDTPATPALPAPGAVVGVVEHAGGGGPRDGHTWRPPRPS